MIDATTGAAALFVDTSSFSMAAKPTKLHDAAQQFEALMVGEMMRSVRESGSEGWMASGDETGNDTAMDMAESQFARALAFGGGLGIAKMIEQKMAGKSAAAQNENAGPPNELTLSRK